MLLLLLLEHVYILCTNSFDTSTDEQYTSLFTLEILRKFFCARVEISILLTQDACECKHKPAALVYTHRCNKVVGALYRSCTRYFCFAANGNALG